ncbi:hypothetical protein HDU86_005337 [Geranomyces michiganensis]|nr:hypothetical protein HDU86_005337 [Geranomyces michiganensis]
MGVEFHDRSNNVIHANYAHDYGRDLAASESFLKSHLPNSSFVGFYNTNNYSEITLSRDFSAWKWIVFPLAAAPLVLALYVNTIWLVDLASKTTCFGHALRETPAVDVSPPLDVSITIALWIGFIFPICVLTPVEQVGYLTPKGQLALIILIPIIVCVGFTPLLVHCVKRKRLTTNHVAVPTASSTYIITETTGSLDSDAAPPPAYSPRKDSGQTHPFAPGVARVINYDPRHTGCERMRLDVLLRSHPLDDLKPSRTNSTASLAPHATTIPRSRILIIRIGNVIAEQGYALADIMASVKSRVLDIVDHSTTTFRHRVGTNLLRYEDLFFENASPDEAAAPGALKPAPALLELADEKKFRSEDGTPTEIETRGVRASNGIFFLARDVSLLLHPDDRGHVRTVVMHKNSSFAQGADEDFLMFSVVRLFNTSRAPVAQRFCTWAAGIRQAALTGSAAQRQEVAASVPIATVRSVLARFTPSPAGVYLLALGTAGQLRNSLVIDNDVNDDDIVVKWGSN